jgi:hypothetical protein
MLTLRQLKAMPPHTIFARGQIIDSPKGVNLTNSGKMLRWVAERGEMHDWTIYMHWATNSWEYILESGDKPVSPENIRKLVPCSDIAFEMFRY